MEIARSTPLSIRFSFDPRSVLRQIVEVLARGFREASEHDHVRMAQVLGLSAYEPRLAREQPSSRGHAGSRASAYAPRWG
jgi:hypothetical protein